MPCPVKTVIKGDAHLRSIAAASILAKTARDRLMHEMDETYPGYGFAGHKGYRAPIHARALLELGPCEIHRLSWAPVRLALMGRDPMKAFRELRLTISFKIDRPARRGQPDPGMSDAPPAFRDCPEPEDPGLLCGRMGSPFSQALLDSAARTSSRWPTRDLLAALGGRQRRARSSPTPSRSAAGRLARPGPGSDRRGLTSAYPAADRAGDAGAAWSAALRPSRRTPSGSRGSWITNRRPTRFAAPPA